ncbi:hypothetical protein L211DRAFT_864251 [Terfezia boudieri ATCC MYA-4762]|uniref:Uncharacterized protein n=1 Tax=Terfezia boudieri ATCC MYA-4762 TaxID=1051890 RepID=A0A3N4MBB3_9PEZI|nr:hypothetical protein L211DRAFT_864251 [Terfezia boudieri ATCC MYA-4762]
MRWEPCPISLTFTGVRLGAFRFFFQLNCPNSISIQPMNINALILTTIECYSITTFLEGANYKILMILADTLPSLRKPLCKQLFRSSKTSYEICYNSFLIRDPYPKQSGRSILPALFEVTFLNIITFLSASFYGHTGLAISSTSFLSIDSIQFCVRVWKRRCFFPSQPNSNWTIVKKPSSFQQHQLLTLNMEPFMGALMSLNVNSGNEVEALEVAKDLMRETKGFMSDFHDGMDYGQAAEANNLFPICIELQEI